MKVRVLPGIPKTLDILVGMRNKSLSSEGQRNSDILISLLRSRLFDNVKVKSNDGNGNTIYIDSDIFAKDMLESFLDLSLSEFNATPDFTDFTLENSRFVGCFAEILVEGATLYALSSKALIERGREFTIKDDGVHLRPPEIAEMLNTQFSTLLAHHWDKLKHIKLQIKSFNK